METKTMTTEQLTPANISTYLTDRGYQAQRAGMAFVKALGPVLNGMTPADRGAAMVAAFAAALDEPATTTITETDISTDLGIRAAAKVAR